MKGEFSQKNSNCKEFSGVDHVRPIKCSDVVEGAS